MIALPSISSSGFGTVSVMGRSRSPLPPAISMARSGSTVGVTFRSMMPAMRPSASRRGTRRMPLRRSRRSSSTSGSGPRTQLKSRRSASATALAGVQPPISARRMSPSVTLPVTCPSASTAKSVIVLPLSSLSLRKASSSDASRCMRCFSISIVDYIITPRRA